MPVLCEEWWRSVHSTLALLSGTLETFLRQIVSTPIMVISLTFYYLTLWIRSGLLLFRLFLGMSCINYVQNICNLLLLVKIWHFLKMLASFNEDKIFHHLSLLSYPILLKIKIKVFNKAPHSKIFKIPQSTKQKKCK